jgi:hypothetical protein
VRKKTATSNTVIDRVIRLRKSGQSGLSISKKTGIPLYVVNPILKKAGLVVPKGKQRKDILKRVNAAVGKSGLTREEIKPLIGYKRASTELFVRGDGLMKYLPRLSKVLKVSYEKLLGR